MTQFEKEIYGEAVSTKMDALRKGIQEIEDRHADYFKDRKSLRNPKRHEKLEEHLVYQYNHQGITWTFNHDSDLRSDIRDEVKSLFDRLFNITV